MGSSVTDLGRQIGERAQAAADNVPTWDVEQIFPEVVKPLAKVDDVITEGPIPANVVDMADVDNDGEGWPRWVRHDSEDRWDYFRRSDLAARWRSSARGWAGRSTVELIEQARGSGWLPFRVLAVREPEPAAEPGRCPTCDSPQPSMHPGVGGGGEVTGLCADAFHQPAAEPRPTSDLLGLVRQYAQKCEMAVDMRHLVDREALTKQFDVEAEALFARIVAEVQRLHDGYVPDGWTRSNGIQRPVAEVVLAEVERLNAEAERVTDDLVKAREQINAEIAQAGEYAAWADQLTWAALKHTGGLNDITEEVSGNEELWRLALDALTAAPQQDGPQVLTLPEVPEGAVALGGIESGRRYARGTDSSGETIWAQGIIGGTLGEVLDGEPQGVTVEMAPPREPRTWPKLDAIPDNIKTVRGASGKTYHRSHTAHSIPVFCEHTDDGRPSGPGIPFHALQTLDGPVTEVTE